MANFMWLSPQFTIRHPGESRDPLNSFRAGSAAGVAQVYWVPAFAGMTSRNGEAKTPIRRFAPPSARFAGEGGEATP